MDKPKIEINFIQKQLWIPPSKCDKIAGKIYGLQRHFNVKIRFNFNNQNTNLTITGAPNKVEAVCQRINIYLVDLPGIDTVASGNVPPLRNVEFRNFEGHRPNLLGGYGIDSVEFRPTVIGTHEIKAPEVAVKIQQKFECSVCFESFNIEEKCIKCLKDSEASEAAVAAATEAHSVCLPCFKSYVHASITGNSIAFGGIGLKCVDFECKNVFLLSSFKFCIDNIDYLPLQERLQQQCIADANLEDLVTCSDCGSKVCVPENQTYYFCVECGRKNCRSCHRIFDGKHFGKTCERMDQEEANDMSLRNLESKMSETVIRRCHKCNIPFVKAEGCNKMECICGGKQCYICGKKDIYYDHFCSCGVIHEKHGPCSKCKKSCRIWENNEELDNINILNVLNSANPFLQQNTPPFENEGGEDQQQNGQAVEIYDRPPPPLPQRYLHGPPPPLPLRFLQGLPPPLPHPLTQRYLHRARHPLPQQHVQRQPLPQNLRPPHPLPPQHRQMFVPVTLFPQPPPHLPQHWNYGRNEPRQLRNQNPPRLPFHQQQQQNQPRFPQTYRLVFQNPAQPRPFHHNLQQRPMMPQQHPMQHEEMMQEYQNLYQNNDIIYQLIDELLLPTHMQNQNFYDGAYQPPQ